MTLKKGPAVWDAKSKLLATILAMGTANPEEIVQQSEYPDLFFRATNSDHMVELKEKFKRICKGTGIQKRHLHLTESVLKQNPSLCTDSGDASLSTRQMIANSEVAALGARAASKALEEWGHSASEITHLIVATSNGVRMPGADLSIARLLGLKCNVQRVLLNQLGCSAGGTALRIAKGFAENGGIGARVLVVCSEVAAFTFRPPNEKHVDRLVGSAVMGDGAAAFVVGCKPQGNDLHLDSSEGIFEIHWAGQFFIPDTEDDLTAQLTEHGLVYFLSKHVPALVSNSVQELLPEALSHAQKSRRKNAGLSSDDIFWAVHPGGRAILDQIEQKLELSKEKLCATRDTLASYGNMSSATVLFVLDRIRQRSEQMDSSTTGEGREWGILLSFGPGLTVEMQLLRSVKR